MLIIRRRLAVLIPLLFACGVGRAIPPGGESAQERAVTAIKKAGGVADTFVSGSITSTM